MCRTLSSVSEKPRPARTRRLYLMVGQRTMGFSLSTGRGATAAAFVARALRRRDFRPGYTLSVSLALGFQACRTVYSECGGAQVVVPGQSGFGHDAASPYGNLPTINFTLVFVRRPEANSRLCCICWLCLIVCHISKSATDFPNPMWSPVLS